MNPQDRETLRQLALRVAEIADLPVMDERRRLWKAHNSLHPVRPMVLIFPEGSWSELLPWSTLVCQDETAQRMEWDLRARIYAFEHFHSDNVVEKAWNVGKAIHMTGWGLDARHHDSPEARGAWAFDPVINQPADLKKLRVPEISIDEKATTDRVTAAQDVFGDILDVRLKGISHVSFHLMNHYTSLRGLEQVMVDMYDEPRMLHDAMAFLEEAQRQIVRQYIDLNLLTLNNDDTYHSSGGVGYTDELPRPDFDPERVRPCDMWASAEAQEMAQVSPEMHEEFILQYERRLLEPFGLNGYGCCEDLTAKLDRVFTIPGIRRISISPWADVDRCAEKLGNRYIFSWKPNPAHLVGEFNTEMVEGYIGHTVEVAGKGALEIILKDTHTCENHPERFEEWSRIASGIVGR